MFRKIFLVVSQIFVANRHEDPIKCMEYLSRKKTQCKECSAKIITRQ